MVAPRAAVADDPAEHTYHHGNLRRALMDEALTIIAEQGADALTLRDLARRTGVTHAAPHHHFRDKTALLTALSIEGWALLDKAMTTAEEQAGASPLERLLAVGRAYILFADEHRDYFAVMLRPETFRPDCELRDEDCQGAAWRHLIEGLVACQQAGVAPQGDPLPIALHLWSLVHGLATMWVMGTLGPAFAEGLERTGATMPGGGGIEALAEVVLRQAGRNLVLAAQAES
jgi:AcrR family transcriptional regulator